MRAFLNHAEADQLYGRLAPLRHDGDARGEVAGLAREDPDLDEGEVRIQWTLGVVDNKATWKPRPKSDAGERVMSLNPAMVDALGGYPAA
jgi:integrase